MNQSSMRYGGGSFDLRTGFLRLSGFLQKKRVQIISSDPKLCEEILASSDTKGTFIEHLIATPAWHPILSTESVDGQTWDALAQKFTIIMTRLQWRDRIQVITKKHIRDLKCLIGGDSALLVDSEKISRVTFKILFELLFRSAASKEDEDLFYSASIEWRKEIGMKGRGNPFIKQNFWKRLSQIFDQSDFRDLLLQESDREFWISAMAQPFIISPQINISDIMVATFQFLRQSPEFLEQAKTWAITNDRARLNGILLESIRLKHPFPILEREVEKGTRLGDTALETKTQFFLLLDKFEQDQNFNPERWLTGKKDNPYHSMPFGAGPRMCIGKPIAMEILSELLISFLTQFPIERIQPQVGHLYSGRDNDQNSGWRESLYQLKTIVRTLWGSWLIGRSRMAPAPQTGCPFKKTMHALGIQ